MAKNTKKTKEYLLIHSRAKVALLGAYLKRYLNVIQNSGHANNIQIFDLFCSEGIYKNGGKGSPIVILDNIKELYDLNPGKVKKWTPYKVIFNDFDPEKIAKLKGHVGLLGLDKLPNAPVAYRERDYQEIISLLPEYFGNNSKDEFFVFIDPYGYKEIRATDIRELLKHKNSEVLLFQPTQFMFRFESGGTPPVLEKFIAEIIPDPNARYNNVWDFIEAVKEGFRDFMGPGFFVDTFTIQPDSATVFTLFFFSSHIRGFEKMLEAKWDLDKEQGKGWKYEQSFDMFSQGTEQNQLEKLLIDFLKVTRSNNELYRFVLSHGFLPKHANEILRYMQVNNRLKAVDKGENPLRKNSFYVNYESENQQIEKGFFTIK